MEVKAVQEQLGSSYGQVSFESPHRAPEKEIP